MKTLFVVLVLLYLASVGVSYQEVTAGSSNEYIYFIAVDSIDLHTRETGLLSAGFTVYYSIGGGVATAMTTPTVAELDGTNQPGEYSLLIDEVGMTTLGATKDQSNMILSISHASIDRVSMAVVVKRDKITSGQTLTVASGAADSDVKKINGVSTSNVTTINANIGTTQPVPFTSIGGTQTPQTTVTGFIGTVVTEAGGVGRLAAAISTWGNVATPVATAASVNQTGDSYSYLVNTIKTLLDSIQDLLSSIY